MGVVVYNRFTEGKIRIRNKELIAEYTDSREDLQQQFKDMKEELIAICEELEASPWYNIDEELEDY